MENNNREVRKNLDGFEPKVEGLYCKCGYEMFLTMDGESLECSNCGFSVFTDPEKHEKDTHTVLIHDPATGDVIDYYEDNGVRKIGNREPYDPILKALKFLAGMDNDYAQIRNNVGFAKLDVEFGHSLASQDCLSEKQKFYGKKLVRKYHRQIPSDLWKEIFGDEKQ